METMLRSLVKKARKSLARRGWWGTLRHVTWSAWFHLQMISPNRRQRRRNHAALDAEFDRKHNVNTAGVIHLADLEIASSNWEHGSRYQPIDPGAFRQMLATAEIDCEPFTFIDFGAGKGRAMLLASEYPFRKIVGVEFAPELVEIARKNLRSYTSASQRCTCFELHCMDAVTFSIPDEPVVLFFFNPFEKPVMARVVDNICQALTRHHRPAVVLYNTPDCEELWGAIDGLKRMTANADFSIYTYCD